MTTYYTGKGDDGKTSTLSGSRILKCDCLVEANGVIDELQSCIGLSRSFIENKRIGNVLKDIQNDLFIIGALITAESENKHDLEFGPDSISKLEVWIEEFSKDLEPLRNFILPGGSKSSAFMHLCRSICRRAERVIVNFSKDNDIDSHIVPYFNRLSSLFFVLARHAAKEDCVEEEKWRGK